MDSINLSESKLESLNINQLKNIDGGIFGEFILGLVGAAVYDCVANHEAFVEGFNEGYNS